MNDINDMNLLSSLPGRSTGFAGGFARPLRSLRFASALALLTLGSCQPAPVPFAELRPLLKTSCALSSSCHAAASTYSGSLSLADADAYCSLVGATKGASYRPTAKAQYPHRVVLSDKGSSFLYQKLILATANSGDAKPLGTVMPLNQPLDAASIDLFARWIDGGAQNDSGTAAPAGCN